MRTFLELLEGRLLLSTAVRLDAGSAANYTDTNGQVWVKDFGFTGGTVSSGSFAVGSTSDDPLYITRRWGNMTYAIPADNGAYTLRLYFTEPVMTAAGKRKFNVFAEGASILSNFDVFAASGYRNALVKSFPVNVSGGTLDLQFQDVVDHAIVSAIELVPTTAVAPAQPANLFSSAGHSDITLQWVKNTESDLAGYTLLRGKSAAGPFTAIASPGAGITLYTDTAAPIGTASYYQLIANSTAGLSSIPAATSATRSFGATTAIRVNAGGSAQNVGGVIWSAGNTASGNWGQVVGGFAYAQSPSPAISGVSAPADNAIYQSEWTGGTSNGGAAGSTAFTYQFPVSNGDWTVKLHFDELNKKAAGQRVFDVAINGSTVLQGFDVFAATGGVGRAIVESFPVHVVGGEVDVAFITEIENAKISGIELIPTSGASAPPPANVSWASDAASTEPVGRYESADVQVGTKLYVMGGFLSFKLDVSNRLDIFDLVTRTWKSGATLPGAQTHMAAASDGNAIYLAGGQIGPGESGGTGTDQVWKYDIAGDHWSPFVALPDKRFAGSMKILNGTLHFFAGDLNDRVTVSHLHWALDLNAANPQWVPMAPIPLSAEHLASAVVNGKIYAIAGEHDHATLYTQHNFVFSYDPATDAWTRVADIPVARSHVEGSTLVIDNRIFVMGGQAANDSITDDVEEYDPISDTWLKLASLPAPRKGSATAYYNGQIFFIGGQSYSSVVANAYIGTLT